MYLSTQNKHLHIGSVASDWKPVCGSSLISDREESVVNRCKPCCEQGNVLPQMKFIKWQKQRLAIGKRFTVSKHCGFCLFVGLVLFGLGFFPSMPPPRHEPVHKLTINLRQEKRHRKVLIMVTKIAHFQSWRKDKEGQVCHKLHIFLLVFNVLSVSELCWKQCSLPQKIKNRASEVVQWVKLLAGQDWCPHFNPWIPLWKERNPKSYPLHLHPCVVASAHIHTLK